MGIRNLVRKPIIDKNGKSTTVLVRPDQETDTRIPGMPTPPSSSQPFVPVIPNPGEPYATRDGLRWNKEKLVTPQVTTENGGVWDVAPPGFSGARCSDCGSFFTDDQIKDSWIMCQICLRQNRGGRIDSAIRYSDVHLLSTEATRDNEWYHITLKPDWDEAIRTDKTSEQPYVHVGSYAAAQHRMQGLIRDAEGVLGDTERQKEAESLAFYCYKVKLTDDASIPPHIIMDADFDAPTSAAQIREGSLEEDGENYDQYDIFGATRYVNEYESHGSISLIAHPVSIEVTERIELGTVKSMRESGVLAL
jgi:hypothetical protein